MKKFLAIILTSLSFVIFYALSQAMPEFREQFNSMGTNLNSLSYIVINHYQIVLIVLAILFFSSLILAFTSKTSVKITNFCLWFCLLSPVTAFLIVGLFLLAVYLPIFTLGA